MPTDHDQVDDNSDLREDEELTADIGSILARATVVPAAIGWWRMRRELRAERQATPQGTTERIRPLRWFEL
jgi:hypothetical protein